MAARANSSRTGLVTLVRRAIHPAMRPVHADVAVASLVTHRPATSHREESTRRGAVGWATERRSSRGFAAATAAMSKEGGDSPRQFDPDDILAPLRDKVERDMAGLTEQTPQQAALERERARREEIAETFEDEDRRVLEDGARDRQALALSGRELRSSLADEARARTSHL